MTIMCMRSALAAAVIFIAVGCAAVPVIYQTRKEARKIDDDQRRTAGIVPGRLFESCPSLLGVVPWPMP